MVEWISVKDELPKPHTPVLVLDKQQRVCIREHLWDSYWSQDKTDVIYWMPLPKPPMYDANENSEVKKGKIKE